MLLRDFSFRLGWIVQNDERSKRFFLEDPTMLTHISPTWYTITKEGDLEGTVDTELIEVAVRSGVSVMPLISNYDENVGFSRILFYELCSKETAIENFINQIAHYKDRYSFSGVNLDFENLSPADSGLLVKFLEKIRDELKDLEISIDVPPRIGGMLEYTADAYDYPKISELVDYVIVMVYDYHWPTSDPGPITPMFWLKNTVNDLLRMVPSEKLVIGLPLYGYDWSEGGPGKGISSLKALQIKEQYDANEQMDNESFESYFEYIDKNGKLHYVFRQNENSIKKRLILLKDMKIKGVAFWYWGAAPLEWFT